MTGIKFNTSSIFYSNMGINFVFRLPEGHCSSDKTANTVISMLDYIIKYINKDGNCAENGATLICMQIIALDRTRTDSFCGIFHRVHWWSWKKWSFYTFSCRSNKNECDGAFVHVKKKNITFDVRTTTEMMYVIHNISINTICVPSTHVQWKDWKGILGK